VLRFALVTSLIGLFLCAAVFVATYLLPISAPEPLWVLFGGIFLSFAPAVVAHPSASYSGGEATVSWSDTLKSAPPWTTVLFVLAVLGAVYCFWALPPGDNEIGITRGDLAGRPDRYRMVVALTSVFYAAALHVAASGLVAQRRLLDLWRSA
jgi:hypothetical protein